MKTLARGALIACAGVIGPRWVRHRRAMYRDAATPVAGIDAEVLARYFSAPVMACVRVATVERIEDPAVYGLMRALGIRVPMELSTVAGMAFGDTVVMAGGEADEARRRSTLFHEMVHVVQYRRLGMREFCRQYVRGWTEGGYFGLALEVEAYAMQKRFDRGEEFEVG